MARVQENKNNSLKNAQNNSAQKTANKCHVKWPFFSVQNFNCAATDYGLCKEKAAKAKYVTERSADNVHLHECGLVINNAFPFLAATPDVKVCEGGNCGLLEVKCPYKET